MHSIAHGGRRHEARGRWPEAPAPFLDLSTGINPAAYPWTPPPPEAWTRLPEPEDLARLEAAAARAYGVEDAAMVVAAPGTQALISWLPRLRPEQQVTIPSPTYAEHAASWRQAGTEVLHASSLDGAKAAVLCNPNNPDGARHDPQTLAAAAREMRTLVIDEAFADFEPEWSLAPLLPLPGVIVLRSVGKAYGLAGLRLGFALAEPCLARQIRAALGPWPVSGPAIAIGIQALEDTAWRNAAAAAAHKAARRLDSILLQAGLRVRGGTALFRLTETVHAAATADRLGQSGILVRSFPDNPTFLRFGLPGNEPDWRRLEAALDNHP